MKPLICALLAFAPFFASAAETLSDQQIANVRRVVLTKLSQAGLQEEDIRITPVTQFHHKAPPRAAALIWNGKTPIRILFHFNGDEVVAAELNNQNNCMSMDRDRPSCLVFLNAEK